MRKNRVIEQNRCYHLVSRLAPRAFFLDDEEKDRAVRKPADKVIAPVLFYEPRLPHAGIITNTRLLYQC